MNFIRDMLDAMSAGNFKTEDGKRLYFPNGVFGGGVVIPDGASEARIRGTLRRFYGGYLLAIMVVVPMIMHLYQSSGLWPAGGAGLAAMVVALATIRMAQARAIRGLERVEARITMSEALAEQSKASPRWLRHFQIGVGLMMMTGGGLMLAEASSGPDMAMALFSLTAGLAILAISLMGRRSQAGS